MALPGVGRKTANVVLLFYFDRPAFPVDTHIYRITRRLGWVPERADLETTHLILDAAVPDELKKGAFTSTSSPTVAPSV